jgi:hypothetical protein
VVTSAAKETRLAGGVIVPNPVQHQAKIVLQQGRAFGQAVLTVTDALGRIAYTQSGLSGTELTFNAGLKPGIYFISVKEGGNVLAHGRFVKE